MANRAPPHVWRAPLWAGASRSLSTGLFFQQHHTLAGVHFTDEDTEEVSHDFTSLCWDVGLTVKGL